MSKCVSMSIRGAPCESIARKHAVLASRGAGGTVDALCGSMMTSGGSALSPPVSNEIMCAKVELPGVALAVGLAG